MGHLEGMLSRLPRIYRDGEQIRGLLGQPGVQLEILDEEARQVQRSHVFDETLELHEAERLAAILGIEAEPWHTLSTYRTWVHALRNARLNHGAVSIAAIIHFVAEYVAGFQSALGVQITPNISPDPNSWIQLPAPPGTDAAGTTSSTAEGAALPGHRISFHRPVFRENPPLRVFQHVPAEGGIEPLCTFSILQRGLDDAYATFLLVGLPGETEYAPALINRTTREALLYIGRIPNGARLLIRPTPDGHAVASLDGTDVTDRLYSVGNVDPGTAWTMSDVRRPSRALLLQRGENDFWFLPIAHFDAQGLDRVLLAMADILLQQGRYGISSFDTSLFYQDPAVQLTASWIETRPATFEVRLPAGYMLRRPEIAERTTSARAAAIVARDQLRASLNEGVDRLRGAGIKSEVYLDAYSDIQPQRDRLKLIWPIRLRDSGSAGIDRGMQPGAAYDITDYNESIFR